MALSRSLLFSAHLVDSTGDARPEMTEFDLERLDRRFGCCKLLLLKRTRRFQLSAAVHHSLSHGIFRRLLPSHLTMCFDLRGTNGSEPRREKCMLVV